MTMAKNGRGGRRNQKLNRPPRHSTTLHLTPEKEPYGETPLPEEPTGKSLPANAIVEILCRTPVKSLVRFRCVCRSWLALLLHPKFITMHLNNSTLRNEQILFHSYNRNIARGFLSFLRLNQPHINIFEIDTKTNYKSEFPRKINFLDFSKYMLVAGSINGVLCLSHSRQLLGRYVVLWNPAINHWKPIRLPEPKSEYDRWEYMSVGLGFDAVSEVYKIIRIVPVGLPPEMAEGYWSRSRIEIYSADRDSWKDVKEGNVIRFWPKLPNCNFIINNIPYWAGFDKRVEVLGAFDPSTGLYKKIMYPEHVKNGRTRLHPVKLRDCVAALVYSPGVIPNQMVDMYVLDEKIVTWVKIYTTGPLVFEELRIPLCFNTGEILVETWTGENVGARNRKPYFYDPKFKRVIHTNGIHDLYVLWYESYLHVESLVCVKGMELIGKEEKNKKTKPRKNRTELLSKDFESVLHLN